MQPAPNAAWQEEARLKQFVLDQQKGHLEFIREQPEARPFAEEVVEMFTEMSDESKAKFLKEIVATLQARSEPDNRHKPHSPIEGHGESQLGGTCASAGRLALIPS